MIKSEDADLCWIKWAAANDVLYEMLRCKLMVGVPMIAIRHTFV
jgi:hypothetical protein